MINWHVTVDVIVRVKVVSSDAPFQNSLNDFTSCHLLIQKKCIIISTVTEIFHINVIQCQSVLKNGYLDIFNFEPGILHFYPSVASLHLSNQFMYHMTISGKCLFGQDGWILASFLFFVFMDRDFVSIYKNAKKKKKKNSANIQPF